MKKLIITTAVLCALSIAPAALKAQTITPYQLIQLYKLYNISSATYAVDAFEYLSTIDKHWIIINPNDRMQDGVLMQMWRLDNENIKQPSHQLVGAVQLKAGTNSYSKMMHYEFVEPDVFQQYQKQMELMQATLLGEGNDGGGHKKTYQVNGLGFILITYPPGVLRQTASYVVTIASN